MACGPFSLGQLRTDGHWHRAVIPILPEGRFAIVTRCGSGCGGRGSAGAKGDDRAGNRESCATRYDTALSQRPSWILRGEHTRASDASGRAVRGRRSRVVPTPGVLASNFAVMWQPTGTRIDQRRGDGGNSATLPRRARRTPLKPSAQGRPATGITCDPPRVRFRCTRTAGAAVARPSLRPLAFTGVNEQQSSGERSRENAQVCLRGRGLMEK